MAVDFPDSPSNGDTTTINGVVYTYNSTKTAWETLESVDANAALSDNPPTNPNNGDLWFNSASGELLVRYNDGTSSQWVGVSGPAGASASLSAVAEDILPDADSSRSLGSPTKKWKDLYLSGSTIYLGDSATLSAAPGGEIVLPSLKIGTGSNAVKLEANSSGGLETRAVVGGTTQAAKPAGGTTQVATLAAMQAIVNPSIGDLCSVTANNTIYMYNGTGFYKIATMVNESPSAITGVDGSYTLATDGTATTITANSSDPEGRILNWSYAVSSGSLTNGGGTTATIAQGTGVNTHVFTITPTTNSAYAGSFSITFNVTDNVNGAVNAVSSFTLAFIVQNSRYTALSVKATNTGSNQTFDDASTSNHTITAAGDVTASTFSPHRHGGYSAYFDGSGDYLTLASNAISIPSSTEFTIECWVYFPDIGTFEMLFGGTGSNPYFAVRGDNTVEFAIAGSIAYFPWAGSVNNNTWYHIAVVRNSTNTIKLWIDGTEVTSQSNTALSKTGALSIVNIGRAGSFPQYDFQGYISDFKVDVGNARYSSNFTPPTSPSVADSNTTFLLGRLPYFKDQSASNHAITPNGNVSLKPKSIYDNDPYSEASHGASAYFDGTGDSLSIPNSTEHDLPGDFTIECWVRFNELKDCGIFNKNGSSALAWNLYYRPSTGFKFWTGYSGSGGNDTSFGHTAVVDEWYHVAICREGTTNNNLSLYVNGVRYANIADNYSMTSTGTLYLGVDAQASSWTLNGYISDARIVKGTALYSGATYTVPTAPLTPDSNTKFLFNPETSISDLSQSSEITCFGDAATSTTQVKFAGTKSIYLDGTGDYLQISNYKDSWISGYTGDYTIEFWWYPTNVSAGSYQEILTAGNGFQLYIASGGGLSLAVDDANSTSYFWHPQNIHTMVNNTWQHLAVVRNGNVYTVYVDGVSKATTTDTDLIGTGTNPIQLGILGGSTYPTPGYFQDLRVTKGLARYTANFTPPTAELEG